jgi:hypothetical protein
MIRVERRPGRPLVQGGVFHSVRSTVGMALRQKKARMIETLKLLLSLAFLCRPMKNL